LQPYSIVISIYGWCAKNLLTNKELAGGFDILPEHIGSELSKLVVPSANSLCIASTIMIPDENEFNLWFHKQPKYP